ncbi:kielin/chordin-like protein [Arctopsyche grandis]|uniref:kielin/chordin-like protein n=1 Tax=Arctopsyche grandis TaxID=121162 RepID=UPI00406DA0D3
MAKLLRFILFFAAVTCAAATSIAKLPPCGCTKPTPCPTITQKPTPCPTTTQKPTPKPCVCEVKKCPGENEEYIYTKYGDPTCTDRKPRSCGPVYECRCKKGYVRHEGKCITLCECPSRCQDPFEVYGLVTTGELTCDGSKPPPCNPVMECRCVTGYVRHEGKCIPRSDCPSKCPGANEVYIYTAYQDETCDGESAPSCEAEYACRCKTGYVRHEGVCIKPCSCPSKCPDPFEEYIVTSYTDETCDAQPTKTCKVQACRCIKGYVRNEGQCIRKCDCPPKCTGANEIYIVNTQTGDSTCDGPGVALYAPVDACRCKSGYVRNQGVCIKYCDCPLKCPNPNEEYVLTSYTDATCDRPEGETCKEEEACRCIYGYVRYEGKCIRKCDCPPKCKGPNEVYIYTDTEDINCDGEEAVLCTPVTACRCKRGYVRHEGTCIKSCNCPPKCQDPLEEYVLATSGEPTCNCLSPDPCTPIRECRCIHGYVRHEGKCIRASQCPPKCSDPNEIYILTKYEDATCDGIKKLCQPVTACRCRKNYVRHEGICIRKCDCPEKCSNPLEAYVTVSTGEETCDGRNPAPCSPVTECRCIEGYVRHEGKCIKSCDCPPKCQDPNEVYGLTKYEDATCNALIPARLKVSVLACRCKKGYVRDAGICIRACDCPEKCKKPNEEYVYAYYGEETCDGRNPDPCSPVEECRCIRGYVRHEGNCIKKCDCPSKCKDPNEVYIVTQYGELTCDEPSPAPCSPVAECRCKAGYVRHLGKCIKDCECPPKCPNPNEEYVWSRYGERTCGEPLPAPCSRVKECRCIEGYVRHEGKCIKQSKCPCGENEFYSDCAPSKQATCENKSYSDDCKPGCMCLPGYVRDCKNKCIKECQCP